MVPMTSTPSADRRSDRPATLRLSLASARKLRFRRKIGNKWERFTLNAQPRSLYLMTGASRHIWEHSIPPVETPRYSITFRTMAQA
jgi:alkylated DNA repair dioxygenase AlkB